MTNIIELIKKFKDKVTAHYPELYIHFEYDSELDEYDIWHNDPELEFKDEKFKKFIGKTAQEVFFDNNIYNFSFGYDYYKAPVNYFIIYDFYLFLINELEILKKILMEKYSHKDVKYLLSRINSFLEKFDFDTFFLENFKDLMMQLNESSLSKLNKIIEILKEEYNIFKKMDPGLDVYSDMIDWIEDALYLLKGFAKKLATSQEEIIHK